MTEYGRTMEKFSHKLVSNLDSKGIYAKDLPDPEGEQQTELHKFCVLLATKLRGVKFAVYRDTTWVYYPDELFARGKITYRDCRRDADGDTVFTYNVYSPFIKNNKSDMWNAEVFFRLSSVNMKTAMRNAVKYLREYSPPNVLSATKSDFQSSVKHMTQKLDNKVSNQVREITEGYVAGKRLFAELKHLTASGHTFVDPNFGQEVDKYFGFVQEIAETKSKLEFTFVFVKGVGDDQEFYTIDLKNLPRHISEFRDEHWQKVHEELGTSSELTEHLLSRVSVLMPMSSDSFLDGIGYKFCDEVYYVLRQ